MWKSFIITLFILLIQNKIYSQIEFNCGLNNTSLGDFDERSQDCNNSTNEYQTKYNRYQFYVDNYSKHPIINIPINIHVWQKSDGSENWQNTQTDIDALNLTIQEVTRYYQNMDPPSDPISGVPFITDTKIRFYVQSIYFYQNDILWGLTGGGAHSSYINEINNIDPTRLNGFNIHITGGYYSSTLDGIGGYANSNHIVTYGNENVFSYAFIGHLVHELGHNLSLLHTYDSGTSETNIISNPDFLDDVFDASLPNWCSSPLGTVCYHSTAWGCPVNDNINEHCTNNALGGTKDPYYFSPKQIAKMHRALSLANNKKYVKCEEYIADPIEITSNETWDFDIKLYNPILIKPGVTLTIQCKVAFASNHQIIVEPGGKLILDGGILTSHCEFWQGIELRGNSNLSQTLSGNQGQVELKNDGIIENALCGIKTVAVINGVTDYSKTGGIIKATNISGTNCTFKNCRTGIEILDYHSYNFSGIEVKNVSRIYNCKFITDDDFESNSQYTYPYAGINLMDVNGVNIVGCLFENQSSNLATLPVNQRGNGIVTLDAAFSAAPRYNFSTGVKVSGTENQFRNLFYAISSGTGVQGTTSNIKDNIFENNAYGVLLDVGMYHLIARNSFTIPGADLSIPDYNYSFGIFSEYAMSFNVEENTFTNFTGNLLPNQAIHSHHSFGPNAKFYRNTVTGTTFGTQTNGSTNNIKIDCNSFNKTTQSTIDIHHASGTLVSQGGSCLFGGSPPAKNLFSGSCDNSMLAQLYKNPGASSFMYRYQYNTLNFSCQNTYPWIEECQSGLNNQCVSTIPNFSIIPFPQKVSTLKSAIFEINQAVISKKSLIDANNTSGLLDLINISSDPEEVKNTLLEASPYLSDEVLIAFILSNPPSGHLKQIILANSPLTEIVIAKLNNIYVPKGIKLSINNAQTGISERNKLETEIEVLSLDKNLELNDLTRIYLDTNWVDSAVVYLKQEGSLEAICALVPIQIKRDTADSKVQMDKILFEATCLEQKDPNCQKAVELRSFCELHNALIRVLQRPGKYLDLTTFERSFLESVALGSNRPAAHARAILRYLNEDNPAFSGEDAFFDRSMFFNSEMNDEGKKYTFEIFPNPTNGPITININQDEIENPTIVITDLEGRIIKIHVATTENTSIELVGISNGTYIVYLIDENKIISTRKISYVE